MATRTVDPARLEEEARALWAALEPAPPVAYDDHGRPVTIPVAPSARHAGVVRAARVIAVSDSLAQAVAALLQADGVAAVVDHVRVDPAVGDRQVMALRGPAGQVVPLMPGATTVRVFAPDVNIGLEQEPVAAVGVGAEPDGWVTAAVLAAALREHLA